MSKSALAALLLVFILVLDRGQVANAAPVVTNAAIQNLVDQQVITPEHLARRNMLDVSCGGGMILDAATATATGVMCLSGIAIASSSSLSNMSSGSSEAEDKEYPE